MTRQLTHAQIAALEHARAVRRDPAAPDAALRIACAQIASMTPCSAERACAADLLRLIAGERPEAST